MFVQLYWGEFVLKTNQILGRKIGFCDSHQKTILYDHKPDLVLLVQGGDATAFNVVVVGELKEED